MITKQDLLEAIAECQGIRAPNANTAIKLAAFYTILDHLEETDVAGIDERLANKNNKRVVAVDTPAKDEDWLPSSSYRYDDKTSSESAADKVQFDGHSEFAQVINGKRQEIVWPVMDELMSTIKVMNERLYNGVMRRLQ